MYDLGLPKMLTGDAPSALDCHSALFLDFDGTLVECAESTAEVCVSPDVPELLLGLCHSLHGAVAVVSGRSLAEIDRFLAPASLAGAGLHGAEMRLMARGPIESSGLPDLNRLAGSLAELYSNDSHIGVEQTDGSVKLHFDMAPDRSEEAKAAMYRLATARSLEVFERDGYIEAKPRGCGKGVALRMLIEDVTFRGRSPVFVGNGATDEAAFRTVSAMGGLGIKVGEGETSASHRLWSVRELHDWLALSLNALT